MKKKINSIAGITLIEILIGVVISTIMMAAMYTSYNVVNSTYSQVTDTAKISQTGRDVVGMIIRDVRMAGYKYFNDDIQTDSTKHIPILITKKDSSNPCDKIEIVFGDIKYDRSVTPIKQKFERIKITYECKFSTIPDKENPLSGGGYKTLGVTKGIKTVYKSKVKWDVVNNNWISDAASDIDSDPETYSPAPVVEYIEDLIFVPIGPDGQAYDPPPSSTNNPDQLYTIKVVDVLLTVRSKKKFFRTKKRRVKEALIDDSRKIDKDDYYLRDTIVISAHARNLGFL
jgi:hypothetical protein